MIDVDLFEENDELDVDFGEVKEVVTSDYRKLNNLPTLNGKKIIDDMQEIDPTVPAWAKEENKPTYTAEEVGAVGEDNEMSYKDILEIWNTYIK